MSDTESTAAQRRARTLIHGQRILVRHLADRAAAWVRAGRRDDLDGIAAVLGCILRLVLLAAGAYGMWWLIRRWPTILWAAVPLWCWAAVRAIPGETLPQTAATALQREQLLALIRDLIGDRSGVHLATLLKHLQAHGQGEDWSIATLRTRLPLLGVPVRKSVKVAKKVAYGVHRDDLPAASAAVDEQHAA